MHHEKKGVGRNAGIFNHRSKRVKYYRFTLYYKHSDIKLSINIVDCVAQFYKFNMFPLTINGVFYALEYYVVICVVWSMIRSSRTYSMF